MNKIYEVSHYRCLIERTSSGYFNVIVYDMVTNVETKFLFSNKEQALETILSLAEV